MMCGRFALSAPVDTIRRHFALREELVLAPRYNIAPSQQVAAIRESGQGAREFAMMRWGLIPTWAKDKSIGSRMINARAETVDEKPSFRASYRKNRCLIPADGFYEWQKGGGTGKTPFFIRMKGAALFALAGLWSVWTDSATGETVVSCTILTTVANELVAGIHDRMPVIVDPARYKLWLDAHSDPALLRAVLAPYNASLMEAFPVSGLCNSPANDSPACVEKLHT